MKALSLLQPWATLVAVGAKRLETRSWSTSYRGAVAIHASKGFPGWARQACLCDSFFRHLSHNDCLIDLPRGAVIAVARLVDCIPVTTTCGGVARFNRKGNRDDVPESELPFGDFNPGRWAWELADVRRLPEPIPARGALGLWEWEAPPEVLALLPEVPRA